MQRTVRWKAFSLTVSLVTLLGLLLSCGPGAAANPISPPVASVNKPVDSYLALAPSVLRAGATENVTVVLQHRQQPSASNVRLALYDTNGQMVSKGEGYIDGQGEIALPVPRTATPGDYTLEVSGPSFSGKSPLKVEESLLVFVETDKPIYKPGQTIHGRVMTLDPQMKPVASTTTTVEVIDAKGLKIFKKEVTSDEYGFASFEVPLSNDLNLGVWKITATFGQQQAQRDVRVEKYVLPKYEVKVELPCDWALVNESIKGTVSAEYSYSEPVKGELEIKASRHVGQWEEYARIVRPIDAKADFELPAVGYVSGVPAAQGQGNVRLEAIVRESATGYEETTEKLLTIAQQPITIALIPDSSSFKPGMPFDVLVHRPVSRQATGRCHRERYR